MAKHVCLDCAFTFKPEDHPGDYICPHWQHEYWEAKGYQRDWGDAAVMNWPHMEILRGEFKDGVKFVILAPSALRRPLIISTGDKQAWGMY